MSDSCSKPTDLRSILRQIEYGRLRRPVTMAVVPDSASLRVSCCSIPAIRWLWRSASALSRSLTSLLASG